MLKIFLYIHIFVYIYIYIAERLEILTSKNLIHTFKIKLIYGDLSNFHFRLQIPFILNILHFICEVPVL